jgi:hypothetical protein
MARFSTAGVGTREELEAGSGTAAEKPGRYRAKIKNVKQNMEDKTPSVLMVCEVTGTGPRRDPLGTTLFHRVYFTEKMRKQVTKLYLRLGLLVTDDRGRHVDANDDEVIDSDALSLIIGDEICGEWTVEKYTDDNGVEHQSLRVPFNELWLASDPLVSSWDCNKGAAKTPTADGVDDDV